MYRIDGPAEMKPLEGAASACARYRKLARTGKQGRVGSLSDSLLEGSGFELSVEDKVASNLAILPFCPLYLGTKLGTIPHSLKRGLRDGETGEQFASATEKWGLAGTGFGAGRATGYPR
jgi:hypothetical protein